MEPKIFGPVLLLSASFYVTFQFPTQWLGFERFRGYNELQSKENDIWNIGANSSPHLFQALCMKYMKDNNQVDWKIMTWPKNHICFSLLAHFYPKKGSPERKRIIFKRSSGEGRPQNNQLQETENQHNVTWEKAKAFEEDEIFEFPGDIEDNDLSMSETYFSNFPSVVEDNQKVISDSRPSNLDPHQIKPPVSGSVPIKTNGGKINKGYPNGDFSDAGSSKNGGVANWVFIAIGTTIGFVVMSIFLLSYVYKTRINPHHRKQPEIRELGQKTDTLLRMPDCLEDNSDLLFVRLSSLTGNRAQDTDEQLNENNPTNGYINLIEAFEMQSLNASSKTFTRCLSNEPKDRSQSRAAFRGGIYSMVQNDGNKLRGGNVDFHRRYVDNPYLCDGPSVELDTKKLRRPRNLGHLQLKSSQPGNNAENLASANLESGWNGSSASSTTSHHSARSYISIPPTSPSGNYVEASLDQMSMLSMKNSAPIKMEWLTKSFSLDHKNELATYQASTGVQTEDSVSPPSSKTVFDTPWQFGGAFAYKGGVLQAGGSDIVLSVPIGAVPRGQAIDIYGSIFTDTANIRRKLEFPSDESLITPVVEYMALPVKDFKRPLHLHLPHSLSAEFDVNSIKVYSFSVDELGKVTISCLPLRDQGDVSTNQEALWEKNQDGNKILITTSHFSGYFCTLCESTSLPSICTMVFGSHVEISEHRREIRVILYIWDRRLTIKDYLERFQKQESEVDRQLLTDMQVPLLNNASSDSRLVMRMEIMGSEEDRQSWRHVARPGGNRLLFKPLQVRRLSEIVQCCRQTDPVRVEWALENRPDVAPGPVFQCCIDILHTPESICDYEAALSEDLDDLMRTFYVRDLKVMSKQDGENPMAVSKSGCSTLKRTLSEALDLRQTEQLCVELGITSKDIGNFHKKFSDEVDIQTELVEECMRRLGHEKFVSKLPIILDRLNLSHLLKDVVKRESKQLTLNRGLPLHSFSAKESKSREQESSLTLCKSLDFSDTNASNSKRMNEDLKSSNVSRQLHQPAMQQQVSVRSVHLLSLDRSLQDNDSRGNEGAYRSLSTLKSGEATDSRDDTYGIDGAADQQFGGHYDNNHHHAATNNKLNSSSGYASVNQHEMYASPSSQSLSLTHKNNLHSLEKFSVVAHADTLEIPQSSISVPHKPLSQHCLSSDNQAYPEIPEELCASNNGPLALISQKFKTSKDSNLNDDDKDQTSKKEMYGSHTFV